MIRSRGGSTHMNTSSPSSALACSDVVACYYEASDCYIRALLISALRVLVAFFTLARQPSEEHSALPESTQSKEDAVGVIRSCSKYALLTALHLLRCESAVAMLSQFVQRHVDVHADPTRAPPVSPNSAKQAGVPRPTEMRALDQPSAMGTEQNTAGSCEHAPLLVRLRELGEDLSQMVRLVWRLLTPDEGGHLSATMGRIRSCMVVAITEVFIREYGDGTAGTALELGVRSNINDATDERSLLAAALASGPATHVVSPLLRGEDGAEATPPAVLLLVFPYLGASDATIPDTKRAIPPVHYTCWHYWWREVLPLLVLTMCMERVALQARERCRLRSAWCRWRSRASQRLAASSMPGVGGDRVERWLRDSCSGAGEDEGHSSSFPPTRRPSEAGDEAAATARPRENHTLHEHDARSAPLPNDGALLGAPPPNRKRSTAAARAHAVALSHATELRLMRSCFLHWQTSFLRLRVALRLLTIDRGFAQKRMCFVLWRSRWQRRYSEKQTQYELLCLSVCSTQRAVRQRGACFARWREEMAVRHLYRRQRQRKVLSAWRLKALFSRHYGAGLRSSLLYLTSAVRLQPLQQDGTLMCENGAALGNTVDTSGVPCSVPSDMGNSTAPRSCYGVDGDASACSTFVGSLPVSVPWAPAARHHRPGILVVRACMRYWTRRWQCRVAAARYGACILRRFLARLRQNVLHRRADKATAERLHRHHLLSHCWRLWARKELFLLRPMRALEVQRSAAVRQWCLSRWKQRFERRILLCEQLQVLHRTQATRYLRYAFALWRHKLRVKRTARAVEQRRAARLATYALFVWKLRASVRRQYLLSQVALADLYRPSLLLKFVWGRWCRRADYRRDMRVRVTLRHENELAHTFHRRRCVERVFYYWKEISNFAAHRRNVSGQLSWGSQLAVSSSMISGSTGLNRSHFNNVHSSMGGRSSELQGPSYGTARGRHSPSVWRATAQPWSREKSQALPVAHGSRSQSHDGNPSDAVVEVIMDDDEDDVADGGSDKFGEATFSRFRGGGFRCAHAGVRPLRQWLPAAHVRGRRPGASTPPLSSISSHPSLSGGSGYDALEKGSRASSS